MSSGFSFSSGSSRGGSGSTSAAAHSQAARSPVPAAVRCPGRAALSSGSSSSCCEPLAYRAPPQLKPATCDCGCSCGCDGKTGVCSACGCVKTQETGLSLGPLSLDRFYRSAI
jgi:hypothetical protein